MNFAILPVAELEIAEAAAWYEDQRPGLGSEFLDEPRRALGRVEKAPDMIEIELTIDSKNDCEQGGPASRSGLVLPYEYRSIRFSAPVAA